MKRKLFLKNIGLSFGAMVASPIKETFAKSYINASNGLKLKAFDGTGNLVKITGKFLDASTLENILARLVIEKEQSAFRKKDTLLNANTYNIVNDLGNAFGEKLKFKVSAPGYKTMEGTLFVNRISVSINSNIWNYNPDFNAEFKPNQHKIENGVLMANFDFHLVKN